MRVKVLRPIKYNHEFYKPGDVIDITEESSVKLFRIKAAEKTADVTPPAGKQAPSAGVQTPPAENQTPSPGKPDDDDQQPEKPIDEMSKDELQAELTAFGVPFESGTKISELKAMLKKAKTL